VSYVVGVPLLALAAVVQATVLARFHLFGGTVDLVLLLALSWTLVGEWQGGVVWGLIGGLFLDALSGGPFGASAFALVLVGGFASFTEGRFWRSHVLLPLATILAGTVIYHTTQIATLLLVGYPVNPAQSALTVTLPAVLFNTLLMLPVYHGVRWLHGAVKPPPVTL
jgi:rod shape-determining protein MreD